jgi:hypothetical protein
MMLRTATDSAAVSAAAGLSTFALCQDDPARPNEGRTEQ